MGACVCVCVCVCACVCVCVMVLRTIAFSTNDNYCCPRNPSVLGVDSFPDET